ncbi:MAG: hypothetical protein RL108_1206 [Bacteroidota bacterium]|jgi:hypothetical protein
MKFDFINTIRYFVLRDYSYSKASLIGPVSFEEHLHILGPENVIVSEGSHFKRIQWEDFCTLYVFRFSHSGEFQLVEREIWYEYQWPSFKKTVLIEVNRVGVTAFKKSQNESLV